MMIGPKIAAKKIDFWAIGNGDQSVMVINDDFFDHHHWSFVDHY